ncbi:MAG: hypothetical protein AD742_10865 [Methylibium sp. NZG]|nr:MAG: hypothetical protein AD742_10865 [Methylibium sp. NZG]
MDATLLALAALAVWRTTHLLHAEAGPGQIFERLRARAGSGVFGQALGCFQCLSLWVALPMAAFLADGGGELALLWLGLSAAAVLLERVTARADAVSAPMYVEDALDSDYPPIQPMDAAASASGVR